MIGANRYILTEVQTDPNYRKAMLSKREINDPKLNYSAAVEMNIINKIVFNSLISVID